MNYDNPYDKKGKLKKKQEQEEFDKNEQIRRCVIRRLKTLTSDLNFTFD